MKTQVSLEYLLVVGIFLLASLLFFYFYYTHFLLSEDTTRVALAQNSLKRIVEVASEVRERNYPSIEVTTIELPEGIENAEIVNDRLVYKIRLKGGVTYASESAPFHIIGDLPMKPGENIVTIKMREDKSIEIIPGLPIPILLLPYSYKKVLGRGETYRLNFTLKNMLMKDLVNLTLNVTGDISGFSCVGEVVIETNYSDGIFTNVPPHFGDLKYRFAELEGRGFYFVSIDSDGDGKYDTVLMDEDKDLSDSYLLSQGGEITVNNTYYLSEVEATGKYLRFCLSKISVPSSSEFNFSLFIHVPPSIGFGNYISVLSAHYENLSSKSLLSFVVPQPKMSIRISTFCDKNLTTPYSVFNPLDEVYFKVQVLGDDEPLPSVIDIFLLDSNSTIVNSTRGIVTSRGSCNGSFKIPMVHEDGYWKIQVIDVGSGFMNQSSFYLDALLDTVNIYAYKDENYTLLCDIFQPNDTVYYVIEIKNQYGGYLSRVINFSVLDPSLNVENGSFENRLISTPYYGSFKLPENAEEGDWTLRVSYKFVSKNVTIRVSESTTTPGSIYWDTLLYHFSVKYGFFFLPSLNCPHDSILRATLKIVDQDGKGVEGVFQTGSTDACIRIMDEDDNVIVDCGIADDLGGGYYKYDFACSQGTAGKSYVLHVIITQHAIPGAGISVVKVKNSRTFNIV